MDDVAGRAVDVLQLSDKFGRESAVAIADQGEMTLEACQLALQSGRVVAECISLGDKAMDCVCCGEG